MPVDPHLVPLLQLMEAAPAIADGSPAEARAALRKLMIDFRDPSAIIDIAAVEDTTVAGVPVRVYRPDGSAPQPTIVFLHGGGFVIGDLDTHDGVCRKLATDLHAVVVSVDYPLAPEHPFPAAVDGCWSVLQTVAENIGDYGADASKLVIGGDSAGGNLSAVCAQLAHADGLPLAAQLLVYPATDLLTHYPSADENATGYFLTLADMEWFGRNYLGFDETDPRAAEVADDPRLSPLRAASLDGLAPAIVATAEFDPLRDDGNAYASALEKAGVPVRHQQFAGLIHGFYGLEQFSPAVADASNWINAQLGELLA